MNMNSKRLCSYVLVAAMAASSIPSVAFADKLPSNQVIQDMTDQMVTDDNNVMNGPTESSTANGNESTPSSNSEIQTEDALKAAIEAATAEATTIQLGTNITVSSTLSIPSGKTIVLDLNGHTLDAATDINVVDNRGNLTVKNGTISTIENPGNGVAVNLNAGATLTVDQDSGSTTTLIGRSGIYNNGGTVTVNGGNIQSYNRNAYWGSSTSTLTVNDGNFTSPGTSSMGRAISTEGDAYIYGGTFYSSGSSGAGDNYMNAIGAFYETSYVVINPAEGKTVSVTSDTDYAVSSRYGATVDIYDGTFACNGDRTDILNIDEEYDDTINIYGGTFKHEPYAEYLADNRMVTQQSNGSYVVETVGEATSTTVNTYEELEEALSGSIAQPQNITLGQSLTIPSGADITLPSTYTLTIPANTTLTVDGILSLEGTATNAGTLSVSDNGFIEYPLHLKNTGTITDFPQIENGVCSISTPMQLQWLSCMVEWNNDSIPEKIALTSNITLPDVTFTPIGNSSFYHNSTFDGKNHTINNLNIVVTSEYQGGFFGNICDATIMNLTLNGNSTNSTSSYIGALAGYMEGSCTVQNVAIQNYTISSNISYGVGGFVGQIAGEADDTVEFINCSSNANITGYANVGGIWGTSTGSQGKINIYNCTLAGNINTISVNGAICGGYAASAPVTVIGLDDTELTRSGVTKDSLLSYTTATNDLDHADASDYKAVYKNGAWAATAPTTATADVNGIPYTSFAEAVQTAQSGDTVNVSSAMTIDEPVTIDKDIHVTGLDQLILDASGSLSISSGTYDSNPSEYLAEGCKVRQNGTEYTVIPAGVYTITFDANGGTCVTTSADTDADSHLSTLPTPTRDGYTFNGWFTAAEGGDLITTETTFSADTTLYAQWTAVPPSVDPDPEPTPEPSPSPDPTPEPEQPEDSETTVTNPDGSTTTTITKEDGSSSVTNESVDGKVEAEVTLSQEALDAAEGPVTLPMPEVDATTDLETAPKITVSHPDKDSVKVEVPVNNVTTGTVAVLVNEDGSETIIKDTVITENGITVSLSDGQTIKVIDNSKTFSDVADNYWGASAIDFATSRELFVGTSDDEFSPEAGMTRAMVWTVLARYEGANATTAPGEAWYEFGREWAMENGISDGTMHDQTITREQLAAMLYRYVGSPEVSGSIGHFADAASVNSWAKDAMIWAVQNGLIVGMGDNALNPQGTATRTQVAAILQRFIEMRMA